jgi:signal transduction histidine kinase
MQDSDMSEDAAPNQAETAFPDSRRWNLISRLHSILTSRLDLDQMTTKIASVLTDELCDSAVVVFVDPDNPTTTFRGFATDEAELLALLQTLVDSVDDAAMSQWMRTLENSGARVELQLLLNSPDGDEWAEPLLRVREEQEFADVAHVVLRYGDGTMRGMLICSRLKGSPKFSESDLSGLVSAADTISLGLVVGDLAEQRRRLLAELITAEQAERQRIAHDVHDDALQILAATQLRLQIHQDHLESLSDPTSVAQTDEIVSLVSTAQRQLRHLLLDLERPSATGVKVHDVLNESAAAFFDGVATKVTVTCQLREMPEDVATVFIRTGREALSNARQHANANNVRLELTEDDAQWRMTVVDDGVGIPIPVPMRPGHLGVPGMATRAKALGGSLSVSRRDEGGTCVSLTIPRRNN